MSYCRFIEADAYIFATVSKGQEAITCCLCSLRGGDEGDPYFYGPERFDQMIAHVATHREAGFYIPEHVDEELRQDRDAEAA